MKTLSFRVFSVLFFVFGVSVFALPTGASAETLISGSIFEDQTWTKAANPYHITANTVVYPSVTLTVTEGTEVLVDPMISLEIRGKLDVNGSKDLPVRMTVYPNPEHKKWSMLSLNTNLGGSLDAEFLEISDAMTGISIACCNTGGPLKVSDSVFRRNGVAIGGYAGSVRMSILRSLFEENDRAITAADKDIVQSTFRNNTYGLYQTERINVSESVFEDNGTALSGGRGKLEYTVIRNNDVGVEAFYEGFSIQSSTITGNKKGIVAGSYDSTVPSIQYSNIFGNEDWNLDVKTQRNVNAKNNWWGTTDMEVVQGVIHDGRDQAGLGLAEIDPLLRTEILIEKPVEQPVPDLTLPPSSGAQPEARPAPRLTTPSSNQSKTEQTVIVKRTGKGGIKGWINPKGAKKGDELVVKVSKGKRVLAVYRTPVPKGTFSVQFDEPTKKKLQKILSQGATLRYDVILRNGHHRLSTQSVFVR